MTPDLDALRAAMVDAILDTPMQPVKPTTGQLVDAILAHPKVAALLAEDARTLPLDVEAVIQRIEEEMPGTFVWRQDVVAHLRAAVSGRSASEPLDVERLARAYHAANCPKRPMAIHSCGYLSQHRRTAMDIAREYASLPTDRSASDG